MTESRLKAILLATFLFLGGVVVFWAVEDLWKGKAQKTNSTSLVEPSAAGTTPSKDPTACDCSKQR